AGGALAGGEELDGGGVIGLLHQGLGLAQDGVGQADGIGIFFGERFEILLGLLKKLLFQFTGGRVESVPFLRRGGRRNPRDGRQQQEGNQNPSTARGHISGSVSATAPGRKAGNWDSR